MMINRLTLWVAPLLCMVSLCNTVHADSSIHDDVDQGIDSAVSEAGIEVRIERLRQLTGELKLDGVLDEPFWKHAPVYDIKREVSPAKLAPSPVRTKVYFARLGDDVVIGFKAFDPSPRKIQAPLRDRDGIEKDDYVGVAMDLAGKRLASHEFYVSASGGQADWIRNNVEGKRSHDWDANWECAAQTNASGYFVEMRIPLSELEIPVDDHSVKRLIVFKRHYPRDVRHYLATAFLLQPSSNPDLPKGGLQVVPSFTFLQEWERDSEDGAPWEDDNEATVSLDIEYSITPSLLFLGTINPDYLDVEADLTETSINNPFTKLVPEKRPFFSRGDDAFGTLYDLVYTRNIEDPYGGAKLIGKIDEVTTGNFVVGDRETRIIVPGNLSSKSKTLDLDSTSLAFRQRYDMERMSMGGILTAREGDSDYHNVVGGFDFYAKPTRTDELRAQWIFSDSQYPEELEEELEEDVDDDYIPEDDPGIPGETRFNERVLRAQPGQTYQDDAVALRYKHSRRNGYVQAQYRDVGQDFRSDLGYMPRVDYRLGSLNGGLDHYISTEDKGEMRFRLSGTYSYQETQAGEPLAESRDIWLHHWGLMQSWVRIGYRNRDRVAKRFDQDTLVVENNAPEFNEEQIEIRLESSPMRNGRLMISGKIGDQIDTDNYRLGDIFEIKPSLTYSIGNRVEISLEDTYRNLDVPEGRVFSENYFRLNLKYQFSQNSFMRVSVIDDWIKKNQDLYLYEDVLSLERETTTELLFNWKPSPRNLFLFGAEFGATDEDEIANPRVDEVACYIKYVRALNL